eukprot:TRINITY_DN7705_c0_g1_i1.p1 TRINITY_DN7705_c0_g1~~TRINITY_DN7705_c0_g1_i1.p1  ORF type:complete len:273 (+),score=44.59 TRINITY_DN7705_c0_g1_i1:157-975(+)
MLLSRFLGTFRRVLAANYHLHEARYEVTSWKFRPQYPVSFKTIGFCKTPNHQFSARVSETINPEVPPSKAEQSAAKDYSKEDPRSQDAQQIFDKMKETGLIPNAVAMLDGLCKDGLVNEAMKLFGEMREKGSLPEVIIYTAAVEGFCRAMQLEKAKKVFTKMKDTGINPNAFTYWVLIQGLCKDKRLDEAFDYGLEMLDMGWEPNVASTVALIDSLCKEGRVEDAKNVMGKFREKGFVPDEKAVREFLDKKGPFFPAVWEVLLGKKVSRNRI